MMDRIHGGDVYSEEIRCDFSANINPLGLPEGVKRVLRENIGQYERYPDPSYRALRQALAEHEGVAGSRIVCGNGASDLIYRIAAAVRPKRALVPAPTFSEYERALESVGCRVEHYVAQEGNDFVLDDGILAHMADKDILFLCLPNNPSGSMIDGALLDRVVKKCGECGVLLVLDECFMDFVAPERRVKTALAKHMMFLKAFTKNYAMAGLRLGYLLCGDESLAQAIDRCGPCWSVSVPAQVAGVAALRESEYLRRTVALVARERTYLAEALQQLGCKVYPSEANFLLLRCDWPLDTLLRKEKIAVRDCSDYVGLERGYFRIAVRTREENRIMIQAMERCYRQWQDRS